ncbi:rhodanese-like domain-containing protein [Micromonospora rifamycinica]|uniref:rhodanese-like domain-containing protein n=1 Tax=Micromonospora rifamycinica TaxID=291594 RepID=UPI002E2C467D|nr:rhodanese-like domain-containing protein [Micromonospora rifamycinica]
MREIDLRSFAAAHRDGALVIDVREPLEYVEGHVSGARLMPLGELSSHVGELPRNAPVYVVCASGNRSLSAAGFLSAAGIDAWSVVGGTRAWIHSGHPVTRGTQAAA